MAKRPNTKKGSSRAKAAPSGKKASAQSRRAPAARKAPAPAPARRGQRLAASERRRELLQVGRALFGERGYEAVEIDDIARAAGVAKGLLYHYFDSKRRFFVEVVRDVVATLQAGTAPDSALPLPERLRGSLDRMLDLVEANAGIYVQVMHGGLDREVLAIVEGFRAEVAGWVLRELGLSEPSPGLRMALRGWIGLIDGATLAWLDARRRGVALGRRPVLRLLARGLEMALASAQASDAENSP